MNKCFTASDLTTLKDLAAKGAKKICGIGTCMSSRKCDHENHDGSLLHDSDERAGFYVDKDCPLKNYSVKQDMRPYSERGYAESTPTENEIFALCALCDASSAAYDEDGNLEVTRDDLFGCQNCAVFSAWEYLTETGAEAEIS